MADPNHQLGRLEALVEAICKKLDSISQRLDQHVEKEEGRLRRIEDQLSIGRFILFMTKAVLLTIVAILTLKFGDIINFWRWK